MNSSDGLDFLLPWLSSRNQNMKQNENNNNKQTNRIRKIKSNKWLSARKSASARMSSIDRSKQTLFLLLKWHILYSRCFSTTLFSIIWNVRANKVNRIVMMIVGKIVSAEVLLPRKNTTKVILMLDFGRWLAESETAKKSEWHQRWQQNKTNMY